MTERKKGSGGWIFGSVLGAAALGALGYGAYVWATVDRFEGQSTTSNNEAWLKIGDHTVVYIPASGSSNAWIVDGVSTTSPQDYVLSQVANPTTFSSVLALTFRWGYPGTMSFKTKTFLLDLSSSTLNDLDGYLKSWAQDNLDQSDLLTVNSVYGICMGGTNGWPAGDGYLPSLINQFQGVGGFWSGAYLVAFGTTQKDGKALVQGVALQEAPTGTGIYSFSNKTPGNSYSDPAYLNGSSNEVIVQNLTNFLSQVTD